MARSPLTLAALATSAISGVVVTGVRGLGSTGSGNYDSAVLQTSAHGQVVMRVPTNALGEAEQGAELVALRAITPGVRALLSFGIPILLGQTPIGDTRAVASSYLDGWHLVANAIALEDAAHIGAALGALHELPTAFITDAGLPVLTQEGSRDSVRALLSEAEATMLVPSALNDRWHAALADDQLWQFVPTVVNGAISLESFLLDDDGVTGIIGWGGLRVDDPANDLSWLRSLPAASARTILTAYLEARGSGDDEYVRPRLTLYAELELVRWLLHGKKMHDQEIVADAVALMDGLVETVHANQVSLLSPKAHLVADLASVQDFLDQQPVASDSRAGMEPIVQDAATTMGAAGSAKHDEDAVGREQAGEGTTAEESTAKDNHAAENVAPEDVAGEDALSDGNA